MLATYLRRETQAGIITLTGSVDKDTETLGLELGADDCISKTYELRQLAARVRGVLRRAAPRPEKNSGFGPMHAEKRRKQGPGRACRGFTATTVPPVSCNFLTN